MPPIWRRDDSIPRAAIASQREWNFRLKSQGSMDTAAQSIDQRNVRGVAQRLTGRIRSNRKLETHGREQNGGLFDGQGSGPASLDPAVLGRRDSSRACDVCAAETAIQPRAVQLCEQV
jgi:hypothetical protein